MVVESRFLEKLKEQLLLPVEDEEDVDGETLGSYTRQEGRRPAISDTSANVLRPANKSLPGGESKSAKQKCLQSAEGLVVLTVANQGIRPVPHLGGFAGRIE